MTQKIHKKQYLRYMKTFVWAMKKSAEDLNKSIVDGRMTDYPVDAVTVENAITLVEAGDCLREARMSKTDVYAIKEAMKHLN